MLHDDTSTDNPTSCPSASAEPVRAPVPDPTDDPTDWRTVLPAQPCPICRAGHDCRRDKSLVACRHVEDHLGTPVTGRDGLTYTVFDLSTLRASVATEIERTLRLFHPTGVIELRLLSKGEKEPTAGYFDCPAKAAKVAAKHDVPDDLARLPQGIYFVLNPLRPATLARAEPNQLFARLQPLASDGDVSAGRRR